MVEFGVLFQDAEAERVEDLVGTPYATVPEATEALMDGLAKGRAGVVVQREDDGPWTVLTTRQEAAEWLAQSRSAPGA